MKKEMKKHRIIKLHKYDNVCVFVHRYMGWVFGKCGFIWSNKKKIMDLFNESQTRIQKDLNVISLLKYHKIFKILMKHSLLSNEIKYDCIHSMKNTIHLDDSNDDSVVNTVNSEDHDCHDAEAHAKMKH